jgi:CBS domain-containing protein
MRDIENVSGLTAGDLVHRHVSTLRADTTVGELRAYFAESSSRRLAVIVEGERFLGSIQPAAVAGADGDRITALIDREHWAWAREPAEHARDLALTHASRRLPVIDGAGALAGIIAINRREDGFCGT